ncbi:MAG: complex I subunit 4 family protein [Candidatus Sericytochromatia bacterium]
MNALLLSILIFLPLLLGLVLLCVPERYAHAAKSVALATAILTLALAAYIWSQVGLQAGLQLVQQVPWVPFLGIDYHVGIDGISLMLVMLTTVFTLIAMLYAWQQPLNAPGRLFALFLVLESGLLGTVLAVNLLVFYLFWELMLIPMFFLIGIWGGPERTRAVTKFVIYTMAGSLVLLLSILYLGVQYQSLTGNWSFDLNVLQQVQMPDTPLVDLLFFGFALAFLIKIPLFPLHTWLPDTYTQAPPVVTFLLSGVMAKMGVYGLLRITMPLFPGAAERWAPMLSVLAIIGIIYGAILALGQDDLKRLVAYSSVSHLGLIALGVLTWNSTSLEGVVYHMLNHAVATGALFLLVGLIEQHYGTTRLAELGGLAATAPRWAVIFVLMSFASVGVPGLNGFVGEFLILLGVASDNVLFALLATLTLILSAAYLLWLIQRSLFGPLKLPAGEHEPLRFSSLQVAALAPLCVLAVVMGIYTQPFTARILPAVQDLSTRQAPIQAQEPLGKLPHG